MAVREGTCYLLTSAAPATVSGSVDTFGAQSGVTVNIGATQLLAANRWAAQWSPAQAGETDRFVRKPCSSNVATSTRTPALAADGTQNDPANVWIPASVPFWWEVDLGSVFTIKRVDDTVTFTTLIVRSGNTEDVGFTTDRVNTTGLYRYIRLTVSRMINVYNGNEADWSAGLHEVTVYGF
ncbi:carbohydrate-binding module family 32 protein [Gonapodya prolifera JEL478]|uniref:Carbohydrate-binding module family 32 protein n=1 Tax=Gonapodya prolifera (strain JEL478) TaxID=1344416 RepID=A0A139AJE1_GONPJ|nr:carbohydrate-binding module family 32 protein [Gonapodya prolifera JEL478]|eukprot:KXS16684.1 carbohydrate-binding module family 32 protein [Gonapodya prolifera JEL478]